MKRTFRRLATSAALSAVVLIGSSSTARAQTCQPGLSTAFVAHAASYLELITAIGPEIAGLQTEMAAAIDQTTYETLLNHANAVAADATLTSGRLVITLPDGTVMVDTSRADNTADPTSNSYQHFLDKTINENHNSRVAIFTAQEYPCGIAVETKTSTTTGQVENYVGVRAGTHLDSLGTFRISQRP
jgi:hypothetical protein